MTILYFTSTGNCLQVAKNVGGTLLSIPQMIKEERYHFEDDVIGLIFPIYGFGLPKIVNRFLEKVSWKADYSFAIGTYGNKPGAAMVNLEKLVHNRGIKFDYMNQLLMVDNFLPVFDIAKQIQKLPEKKTEENLQKIVADIHARKTGAPKTSLMWRGVTVAVQILEGLYMNGEIAQKNFTINEKCTNCGICAKVCPTGNVSVTDKVIFSNACEACLGCVHHCPRNAIHMKRERSSERFRNPEVTLEEIQEANSQKD